MGLSEPRQEISEPDLTELHQLAGQELLSQVTHGREGVILVSSGIILEFQLHF